MWKSKFLKAASSYCLPFSLYNIRFLSLDNTKIQLTKWTSFGHSLHRKVSFHKDIYPCTPGYWISVEEQLLLRANPARLLSQMILNSPWGQPLLNPLPRWIANWSFSFNGFGKCLGVFPLILVGREFMWFFLGCTMKRVRRRRKRQRRNNQATFPRRSETERWKISKQSSSHLRGVWLLHL